MTHVGDRVNGKLCLAAALAGLSLVLADDARAFEVKALNPPCADGGDVVALAGKGLQNKNVKIRVGALAAEVLERTPHGLVFAVPDDATSGKTEVTAELPSGKADGIEFVVGDAAECRRLAAHGSSSGIAKGDFNGDGFGDLAIGMPHEDTGGVNNAGAVIVIYGSANGLAASSSTRVLPAQFWSQGSDGVPGRSEKDDRFGSSLAAGDFNADNFSDLAIGSPKEDVDGVEDSGAVTVIYGSQTGLTTTSPTSPAPQLWTLRDFVRFTLDPSGFGEVDEMTGPNEEFGTSLAWGDFNGDQVGDLAIGIPKKIYVDDGEFIDSKINDAGGVAILYGTATGAGLTSAKQRFIIYQDTLEGLFDGEKSEVGDRFGQALAAGDFNGDGRTDLAVGAPGETLPATVASNGQAQDFRNSAGLVNILFGRRPDGLRVDNSQELSEGTRSCSSCPASTDTLREADDDYGSALAAGDFDGSGRDDLAIGIPGESIGDVRGAGAVQVVYGGPNGLGFVESSNQTQILHQNNLFSAGSAEPDDHFGAVLAAGDFNGDGKKDLAVGVPFEDLRVTRNGSTVNLPDAGEVDIVSGSTSTPSGGLVVRGRRIIQDNFPFGILAHTGDDHGFDLPDHFGAALTAWNFGNGSQADLAIAVPGANVGSSVDGGAVNVGYGSPSSVDTVNRAQYWHQDSAGIPGGVEDYDFFGEALY